MKCAKLKKFATCTIWNIRGIKDSLELDAFVREKWRTMTRVRLSERVLLGILRTEGVVGLLASGELHNEEIRT